jgi:hypothetical protein
MDSTEREAPVNEDIFHEKPDDNHPVTRGEMRQIVRDIRTDLKWSVAIVVVAGQTLNHIQLPPIAGFIGGVSVVVLGVAKLFVAR